MKILEMTEATRSLASYTSEVAEEPLVVTADGQPVAALMGIANADLETVSLSTNPRFIALIERKEPHLPLRHQRDAGREIGVVVQLLAWSKPESLHRLSELRLQGLRKLGEGLPTANQTKRRSQLHRSSNWPSSVESVCPRRQRSGHVQAQSDFLCKLRIKCRRARWLRLQFLPPSWRHAACTPATRDHRVPERNRDASRG